MAVVNRRISLDFHLNEASAVIRHRFEWGVCMSCHSCANFSFLTMSQNAWKKGAALTVRLLNWRFTVSWQGHYRPAEADGRRRAAGVGEGPPARRPAEGAVCGCGARGGPCGYAARGRQSAGAGHDRGTAAQAGPLIRSRLRRSPARLCLSHLWGGLAIPTLCRYVAGPGRAGPDRTPAGGRAIRNVGATDVEPSPHRAARATCSATARRRLAAAAACLPALGRVTLLRQPRRRWIREGGRGGPGRKGGTRRRP
jgi:hypothetical protein